MPDRLQTITPEQRKSGLAAWLGWFFDGLDMHIYTLVATLFVALLFHGDSLKEEWKIAADSLDVLSREQWIQCSNRCSYVKEIPFDTADTNHDGYIDRDEFFLAAANQRGLAASTEVRQRTSWIQAAFLIGWAIGGTFFGRLGDLIGRSRALSLTVLTYAAFTGLSFFAQTWWHLLIFRFLAALGIGGEWAVGSTLIAETWPKAWRPWTAAVLQAGVNLGILVACAAGVLLSGSHPRYLFLIGIIPAVLVFYIRRHVPEPAAWVAARKEQPQARVADLFRGETRRVTLVCVGICAFSLTAWWAFIFWQAQHLRSLPEVVALSGTARDSLLSATFAWIIGVSIVGNFAAGWLASRFGYKATLVFMFSGFAITMCGAFGTEHALAPLSRFWLPAVAFWSGVFGLFTMLLPPLFPTLLRTTGAGFSYNIGRIAAAIGTIFAAQITAGGNFRVTLFYDGLLFLPAIAFALMLPRESK